MTAIVLAVWEFLKAVPWYVYGFGLCFMLGGCACHALHRGAPEFVAKLP